jgi:uncharacterized protein YpbB
MLHIESIILNCLHQINSERTIYSVYHLLNGKKSSQTIQDAHLFSLKNYFGIYEHLTRDAFDEIYHRMTEKEWLINDGEQHYSLTASGMTLLENKRVPKYINGWKYHQITKIFWERLSLFIQVISNLSFGESRYLPIQKDREVHVWVKTALKDIPISRRDIGSIVYKELTECFNGTSDIDPSLVVFRLTGFQSIGLTHDQAAQQLNLNVHDYHIRFINTIHFMIQKIRDFETDFEILTFLIKDLIQEDELTLSSRKTQKLLYQGYTLEKIANIRNLKLSTIEDHLVELALHVKDFSLEPYVNHELMKRILEISRKKGTKQLKVIREEAAEATYFQIRLVLAKYGDRLWN